MACGYGHQSRGPGATLMLPLGANHNLLRPGTCICTHGTTMQVSNALSETLTARCFGNSETFQQGHITGSEAAASNSHGNLFCELSPTPHGGDYGTTNSLASAGAGAAARPVRKPFPSQSFWALLAESKDRGLCLLVCPRCQSSRWLTAHGLSSPRWRRRWLARLRQGDPCYPAPK